MKRYYPRLIIASLFLFSIVSLSSAETKTPPSKAIIILSTNTLSEMHFARQFIEQRGSRVINVFPPSAFIGIIPKNIERELRESGLIKEIAYSKVDSTKFSDYESSTIDAISFWNMELGDQKKSKVRGRENIIQMPFQDHVIIPDDLHLDKEQKTKKSKIYLKHWQLKKNLIEHQEASKRQKWMQKRRTLKKISLPGQLAIASPQSASSTSGAFGKTTGAGYYDTSLYMAGNIAVGIFFLPGESGEWPRDVIDSVFNSLCSSLNQFNDDESNAHIAFTYVKEIDPTTGNPNPFPREPREYINDLRNTYSTNWAYVIKVYYGSGRALACYWGPYLQLYSQDLRDGYAVRHETMHIFGAMDQYHPDAAQSSVNCWGYLNVVNANSQYNDGKGYFSGAGEGQPDIMISGGPIGLYSRGQIGWRDSDGDGILDPIDTMPETSFLSKNGNNPYTFYGKSKDVALPNTNPVGGNDVTLNNIVKVEYRINNNAWQQVLPTDGCFDSGEENFSFQLPLLPNGDFLIEARAVNSVGNSEISYAREKLTVTNSNVSNVPPFASFEISPKKAKSGTSVMFDASSSSDLEDDASVLQIRWDFDNDGIWDTAFSTNKKQSYSYTTPGIKEVHLEIQDTRGVKTSLIQKVEIATDDQPPSASFTVTPENQHSDSSDGFIVRLDAGSSFDPERGTQGLMARWDFDSDGIWDTEYLPELSMEHSFQLPKDLRVFSEKTLNQFIERLFVHGNKAYVSGESILSILDITDPSNQNILGQGYIDYGNSVGIKVEGDYAYISKLENGVSIFNVSDPRSITRATQFQTYGQAFGLSLGNGYAFIADGVAGLTVADVRVPNNVSLVANIPIPSTMTQDIIVKDNYAYLAAGSSGMKIFDISDPVHPQIVGECPLVNFAEKIFLENQVAFVVTNDNRGLNSIVHLIDISTPNSPRLRSSYRAQNPVANIYVSEGKLYLAEWLSLNPRTATTLEIITIVNPDLPQYVSGFSLGSLKDISIAGSNIGFLKRSSIVIGDMAGQIKPTSKHWKIRGEFIDAEGNTSDVSRDVWAVTYNHSPVFQDIIPEEKDFSFLKLGNYRSDNLNRYCEFAIADERAYLVDRIKGVEIVDIADPGHIIKQCGYFSQLGMATGVAALGNYVFVTDFYLGLHILDATYPDNIQYVTGISCLEPRNVVVSGEYAYLITGMLYQSPQFMVIDIRDLSNPSVGSRVIASLGLPNSKGAEHIILSGNYAYVLTGYGGLHIIDISNPVAPRLVSSLDTPGFKKRFTVSGNYAYVVSNNNQLDVIDIANPSNPQIAFEQTNLVMPVDVSAEANSLYVVDSEGVKIFDITNPIQPVYMETIHYTPKGTPWRIINSRDSINILDYATGLHILENSKKHLFGVCAIGGSDLDSSSAWDGSLRYRWDFNSDGSWDTPSSEGYDTVPLPGQYWESLVTCQISDRFGSAFKVKRLIDLLPPVTNVSGCSEGWLKRPVTITLNAIDGGSGIRETLYSIDGTGPLTQYTASILLNQTGTYPLKFYSIDNYGNKEIIKNSEVRIDLTPPLVTQRIPILKVSTGKLISLNVVITDVGSGVKAAGAYWWVREFQNFRYVWVKKGFVPLKKSNDHTYSLVLPPIMQKNTLIRYRILALDNAGNGNPTANNDYYILVR